MATKAQHTPGPWRTAGTRAKASIGMHVRSSGGPVCIMFSGAIHDPKSIANCTLIAAAPELLQECHLALACLEGMQTEVYASVQRVNESGTPGIIMKRLRSAIAKAEGK